MFVWKDEDKWKRRRGWSILKTKLSSCFTKGVLHLGKCYNVPPEFLEKKRKPRLEQTPAVAAVAAPDTKSNNFRDPKFMSDSEEEEQKDSDDENVFNNIPAIMPYEAKQALLREISKTGSRKSEAAAESEEEVSKLDRGTSRSGKRHGLQIGGQGTIL